MKATMIVPTYWGERNPASEVKLRVYDHPTYLDSQGTLTRLLESLSVLEEKDFHLVIIAVANADNIEKLAEEKVKNIIQPYQKMYRITVFSYNYLAQLREFVKQYDETLLELVSLNGYSHVRNMCILAAHLDQSEGAVLIDDDEIFEDPFFMRKALEFIGEDIKDGPIYAKAGFYIQAYEGYLIKEETIPEWDREGWGKIESMNAAFRQVIGKSPRIKDTPFVFGGNMIIHRKLFEKVCFDPGITRGEDIDYLVNAKMMGFRFVLDNELSIRHLPPHKEQPDWQSLREDILRFLYMRKKLYGQEFYRNRIKAMVQVEELDPYPGRFLRSDLEDRIKKANELLGSSYLKQGNEKSYAECQKNISLIEEDEKIKAEDVFQKFLELQKKWQKLIEICRNFKGL